MAQTNTGFNLSKATIAGRNVVKWGIISLAVLIFGRFALEGAIAFYKYMNPPAPPPPTMGFRQLPPIAFPPQAPEERPVAIIGEFPYTAFPDFGDRLWVFFMPTRTPSLLDIDRAQQIVARLGFGTDPQPLGDHLYSWNKLRPITSRIEMDILTHNLVFSTDYMSRPELILNQSIPTGFDASQNVKSFLGSGGLLPADMATASAEIYFLRLVGGELRPAIAASEADFVEVNINRTPINGQYKFYTPDGRKGVIHAIVSGNTQTERVVHLERNYFDIDYQLVHTYPLRSAASAWQILESGGGYVADPGTLETAVVREVELGYYDSFEHQPYMQPIYVFKGDAGFKAYVSALAPQSFTQ